VTDPIPSAIRLDKWLWHARFAKSRRLAADIIARGVVRMNARRVTKPSTPVRVGDGLAFVHAGQVRAVRVRALGERRGPAAEARKLYLDIEAEPPPPLEPTGRVDK
jgi:ribosome-associated heat shock protein Hsp15